VRGGPPHILSQSSSMPYLEQRGVMLTPVETSGDFHNMPDLIHQQQETSRKKVLICVYSNVILVAYILNKMLH